MLGSGETKISRDPSLPYTEGDRSQADTNTTEATAQLRDTTRLTAQSQDMTRLTGQLEGIMRLATQPENTTRLTVQTGVLTRISGLEDGKEVTRPDEKQEGKSRHSAPKKGDPIDRGVYVIPLKESVSMRSRKQETIPWTRTKQVYGWTEASREWHCRMSTEIMKFEYLRSEDGYAVHNSWKSGGIQGQRARYSCMWRIL